MGGFLSNITPNELDPGKNRVAGALTGQLLGGPIGGVIGGFGGFGGLGNLTDPVTTDLKLNPFQQTQLGPFQQSIQEAQNFYNQGQLGQVAPFSPFQQFAQGGTMGAAQNFAGNVNPMLQGALGFGLQGALDVQNNPYLQQAISAAQQPTIEAFQRGTQNIGSAAQQAGAYGGARQGILESNLSRDFGRALSDQAAQMGSQAYGQGLQAFSNTLGQAPGIAGLPFDILNQVNAYGGQQQGQQQAQLNAPLTGLQQYQGAIFPQGVPGQVSPPTAQASPFMQLAGLGIAGAGAVAPFLKPTA